MIQKCCPDMNLAIEDYLIKEDSGHAHIDYKEELWDIDFCPFCGKEIVLVQKQMNRGELLDKLDGAMAVAMTKGSISSIEATILRGWILESPGYQSLEPKVKKDEI